MMNTVILLLVSLVWGQFPGFFKHPRSFIECSHYLRVSTSPLLRFLKKKKKLFPPQTFRFLLQTFGEVTIDRWGSDLLFKVAAFTAGQGAAPEGTHPAGPPNSLLWAARPTQRPSLGPARPTPSPGPGPPRSSVPFHFADSLKTAVFPSRPCPSRPSARA